jgi:hypothetical protein
MVRYSKNTITDFHDTVFTKPLLKLKNSTDTGKRALLQDFELYIGHIIEQEFYIGIRESIHSLHKIVTWKKIVKSICVMNVLVTSIFQAFIQTGRLPLRILRF